jgi:hypothetical protein
MSNTTLYIYITDVEAFLAGNLNWSLDINTEEPNDDNLKWHRENHNFSDKVFLAEVNVECTHSVQYLSEVALERIAKLEQEKRATLTVELKALNERKQKLLSLPHLGS